MRLCAASRPVSIRPLRSSVSPGLPAGDLLAGQRIEVDPARGRARAPGNRRPCLERRRIQRNRTRAVEHEVRVPGRGAVRDHRDGLRGGMGRVALDLDVEDSREPAQPLRADPERVHLLVELDTQLLERIAGSALEQLVHVDRIHQRFLREEHGLFGRPAHADPEHPRRAPARAHRRHGPQHPVGERVARVEHHELRLVLRAAALGRDRHIDRVAGHQFDMQHRRRVVARVAASEERVVHDGGAQPIVGMLVGAAHAFVGELGEAQGACRSARSSRP